MNMAACRTITGKSAAVTHERTEGGVLGGADPRKAARLRNARERRCIEDEERVVRRDETADRAGRRRRKRALELARVAKLDRLQLHPERPGGLRGDAHHVDVQRVAAIEEHAGAGQRGRDGLQKLQSFGDVLRQEEKLSRDVAARVREAGGHSHGHNVGRRRGDDSDDGRGAADRDNSGTHGHDGVGFHAHEFGCEQGQPPLVVAGGTMFDMEVLALDPADIAEPGGQLLVGRIWRRHCQKTDTGDVLLRRRSERPRRRRAAKYH